MPKRITITYECDHPGDKLRPVEEKFWDTAPSYDRVCYCLRNNEKAGALPTKMKIAKIEVVDSKPE